MPGTQYPLDTVQLYPQHFFCPVLLLHIPPDGPHPPPTATALTSVYHANTLHADVDPSEFYPTVCCVLVCPSAPFQLRGPVSFPIFQPTTGWVGPSSGLLPRHTPKGCGHIALPAPPPMADNGTSISNATMPIRDPAPSGRRPDGDHARVGAHVKPYLPLHPTHDACRPPLAPLSAWVWLPMYYGLALLIWTMSVHCGLVLPKKKYTAGGVGGNSVRHDVLISHRSSVYGVSRS